MVEIGMEVEIGVWMRMRMEMARRAGLYQCAMEMDGRHVCASLGRR
jgi:hypothetical protein